MVRKRTKRRRVGKYGSRSGVDDHGTERVVEVVQVDNAATHSLAIRYHNAITVI